MNDESGDYWRELKELSKQKRASNREHSATFLQAAGITFESKNNGAHLVVTTATGKIVDFWPGTGLWIPRGTKQQVRGVSKLIHHCKQGAAT